MPFSKKEERTDRESPIKGSQGEKNPWCFLGFLGIFEKAKEKKDREWG